MNNNSKQLKDIQDAADDLIEAIRLMHLFISNYMPNEWEIGEEYAAITKKTADAIGKMNQFIQESDYGCLIDDLDGLN